MKENPKMDDHIWHKFIYSIWILHNESDIYDLSLITNMITEKMKNNKMLMVIQSKRFVFF